VPRVEPGDIERAAAKIDDHHAAAGLGRGHRAVGQVERQGAQRLLYRHRLAKAGVAGQPGRQFLLLIADLRRDADDHRHPLVVAHTPHHAALAHRLVALAEEGAGVGLRLRRPLAMRDVRLERRREPVVRPVFRVHARPDPHRLLAVGHDVLELPILVRLRPVRLLPE